MEFRFSEEMENNIYSSKIDNTVMVVHVKLVKAIQ